MPRENRKRGKKHKKSADDAGVEQAPQTQYEEQDAPGPSWIVSAPDNSTIDQNAPFGYVDPEVKAYFRTVDVQIREWQETRPQVELDEDGDPNEERRMFFVAALTEMSGKEKQLATDPDCSTILERMIHSMDDFVRRVFMDRLDGSLEQLSKHRFASHVCQTLLTVASDTVARESRGIIPTPPDSQAADGELRTFTQLTLDACRELSQSLSSLVLDPFASHVIRALLLLLGSNTLDSRDDTLGSMEKSSFALRSKKSAAYKARQGSMKSVFVESEDQDMARRATPPEFRKAASSLLAALRDQLDENEVRALAANQVASPVLQMLLELEADYGEADTPGSLMDRVLAGLISAVQENSGAEVPESDYLVTLLRDPIASHLLETLIRRSPQHVFGILWQTYFANKLSKLAVHPVANFVVSKGLERLDPEQLSHAVQELHGVAGKIVKNSRTGVLKCMVERASSLQVEGQAVVELILSAFELENRTPFVACALRLKSFPEYQRALATANEDKAGDANEEPRYKRRKSEDPLEPKTQGAILLQSMLRLPSPHNAVVLDSIQAMALDDLTQMAHHATSSRVLDAVLDSSTVPLKAKRKLIMTFLGHFHILVDDRIGSRVGDRCWASADPYLKEKIARSLIPHEHTLAGSFYGKFFVRNLNLHLLQRDPERWKNMQPAAKNPTLAVTSTSASAYPQRSAHASSSTRTKNLSIAVHDSPEGAKEAVNWGRGDKGKRKAQPADEIDALFNATLGKKVKKAELAAGPEDEVEAKSKPQNHDRPEDGENAKSKRRKDRDEDEKDLNAVLGAIRSAPRDDTAPKKRKRAH